MDKIIGERYDIKENILDWLTKKKILKARNNAMEIIADSLTKSNVFLPGINLFPSIKPAKKIKIYSPNEE